MKETGLKDTMGDNIRVGQIVNWTDGGDDLPYFRFLLHADFFSTQTFGNCLFKCWRSKKSHGYTPLITCKHRVL